MKANLDFSEDDDLDEMCKAKDLLNDNVDRSEATAEESEGNGVSDGESEPNGSDQKSSERLQPPEAFKRNKVKVRYFNSETCPVNKSFLNSGIPKLV